MTLVNVDYTGDLGTAFVGVQWAYVGGELGVPPGIPPPVEERFRVRQIVLQVFVNDVELDDVQWVRCRFSRKEPVSTAELICPVRHGDYNQEVRIVVGAIPGNGPLLRFKGLMRNPNADLYPRSVSHALVGYLQLAAEFFPSEGAVLGSNGNFGLLIPHILGSLSIDPSVSGVDQLKTLSLAQLGASASAIHVAVLNMAGLSGLYSSTDIHSSPRIYGIYNALEFKWAAGSPTHLQIPPDIARESALQYMQRYDEVDAEWGGADHYWEGGFYRLTEALGRIYRIRTGGKPASIAGSDPAAYYFTFVEGFNVLEGSKIERQYPQGNRCWVTGYDHAGGFGPSRYLAVRNNPIPGFGDSDNKIMPNAPSSSMIEWSVYDDTGVPDYYKPGALQYTDVLVSNLGYALPFEGAVVGQDAQTVAEATLVDGNKETPAGQIVTAEDAPFLPGISVLLTTGSGIPDRLLSGEPFLIDGLTIDCGHGTSGEPNFRQTLDVAGGGIDANQAQGDVAPVLLDVVPPGVGNLPLVPDPAGPSLPLDAGLP